MAIITTLSDAENFAATFRDETLNLPTLEEYIEGLRDFQKKSSNWFGYDGLHKASRWSYNESCDGAGGGLDVSWAFHKDVTNEEILKQYILLCEELRESLEDNGIVWDKNSHTWKEII